MNEKDRKKLPREYQEAYEHRNMMLSSNSGLPLTDEEKQKILQSLIRRGWTVENIATATNCTEEDIKQLVASLSPANSTQVSQSLPESFWQRCLGLIKKITPPS